MVDVAPTPILFRRVRHPTGAGDARLARRGAALPSPSAGFARGSVKQSVRVGAQRGGFQVPSSPAGNPRRRRGRAAQRRRRPGVVLHRRAHSAICSSRQAPTRRSRRAMACVRPGTAKSGFRRACSGRGSPRVCRNSAPGRGAPRRWAASGYRRALEVITGIGRITPRTSSCSEVVRRVDAQVDTGCCAALARRVAQSSRAPGPPMQADARLIRRRTAARLGPRHVSETSGHSRCCGCSTPQRVQALFDPTRRRLRPRAFPTLRRQPRSENALTPRAFPVPEDARLQSRSRIPARGLVRRCWLACAPIPTSVQTTCAYFTGDKYRTDREALRALAKRCASASCASSRRRARRCPSPARLLAYKRLDAYVSILSGSTLWNWRVFVARAIVDFLGEVAQRPRTELLPGLAAQIPAVRSYAGSMRWTMRSRGLARGCGDHAEGRRGDFLAQDACCRCSSCGPTTTCVQNALDVCGRAPVRPVRTFLFDQGARFPLNYFSQCAQPPRAPSSMRCCRNRVGFASWGPCVDGESSDGRSRGRPGERRGRNPSRNKPAVLAGEFSQHFKSTAKPYLARLAPRQRSHAPRIQQGYGRIAVEPTGRSKRPTTTSRIFSATSQRCRVRHCDWRVPMEEEARRLASAVDTPRCARGHGQPSASAHSMGGLVVRTMQLEVPMSGSA